MQGLLLFGHGARDPAWAEPFRAVAARLAQRRPALRVELAFLELMPPDLATAAGTLVAAGCRRVRVVPLFLGTGGHVKRDLPRLVDTLRERHPQVAFELCAPIGEHAAVVDAIATAACEGLD